VQLDLLDVEHGLHIPTGSLTVDLLQYPLKEAFYGALENASSKETPCSVRHKRGPVAFGEALPAGTLLTFFSDDKPDRFFTVIEFWLDETSGVALALEGGVRGRSFRVRSSRNRSASRKTL
jgi:hypothetical protein